MKLTSDQKKLIVAAIDQAERCTSGEIRVHISYSFFKEEPLVQAKKQFEKLKMHETKDRNGILLYVNPRSKKFAVFGDMGIHQKVGQEFWNHLKDELHTNILEKDLTSGIVNAVKAIGEKLTLHFPCAPEDKNELSDDITES